MCVGVGTVMFCYVVVFKKKLKITKLDNWRELKRIFVSF